MVSKGFSKAAQSTQNTPATAPVRQYDNTTELHLVEADKGVGEGGDGVRWAGECEHLIPADCHVSMP